MQKRFLTVEGIEGAGKSTAIESICTWIRANNAEVLATREPGGTPLGEELRTVLLEQREGGMSAEAELLLMFAARAQHLERVIEPTLAAGQWVVCDRFTDASIAYQGAGRGLGVKRVEALAHWLHPARWPDLTLWLDVPVKIGLERAAGRSAPDRFESEKARFFERVRAGYAGLAQKNPERIVRIDASADLATVNAAITTALSEHCSE
ncbi:MAG: dTMP kinase [Spiribacter sp.]|jgi:dTMP kinase|nr:dTMP kinase [Spiribacter sp.]MDR9489223.1 dTMP kinase [Spiribacter sp.]